MSNSKHAPPSATVFFDTAGLQADPWQEAFLTCPARRLILNGARHIGKSTVVAALALGELLRNPGCLIVVLARAEPQALELFHQLLLFYDAVQQPLLNYRGSNELKLATGSRVLCLPYPEDTLRGSPKVSRLIVDDAARVPDELYRAVRPFLAVTDGRLVLLSTPCGRRGFYDEAWHDPRTPWTRFTVPASLVPRLNSPFLAEQLSAFGPAWYAQEYRCEFLSTPGIVFPDFVTAVSTQPAPPRGRRVGGIAFGFGQPFAAVWGIYDQGELWLDGEYYDASKSLSDHLPHLPRPYWYVADPGSPDQIALMRRANFRVAKGFHSVGIGLSLLQGRLANNSLHVHPQRCPNLCREAQLYRYADADENCPADETPLDQDNHSLSALRYLVSRLDALPFRRALLRRDPGIRGQRSEIRGQRSEVRDQRSEVRSQESARTDPWPLTSDL